MLSILISYLKLMLMKKTKNEIFVAAGIEELQFLNFFYLT